MAGKTCRPQNAPKAHVFLQTFHTSSISTSMDPPSNEFRSAVDYVLTWKRVNAAIGIQESVSGPSADAAADCEGSAAPSPLLSCQSRAAPSCTVGT